MANSIFLDTRNMAFNLCVEAGRAETAAAPPAFRQGVDRFPGDVTDRGDDHLGDAHARLDGKGFGPDVGEDDHDLAAVIGIDGAGRVDEQNAVTDGQAGARPHLGLVALGQRDGDARGTSRRAPGATVSGASTAAIRSTPALPGVA